MAEITTLAVRLDASAVNQGAREFGAGIHRMMRDIRTMESGFHRLQSASDSSGQLLKNWGTSFLASLASIPTLTDQMARSIQSWDRLALNTWNAANVGEEKVRRAGDMLALFREESLLLSNDLGILGNMNYWNADLLLQTASNAQIASDAMTNYGNVLGSLGRDVEARERAFSVLSVIMETQLSQAFFDMLTGAETAFDGIEIAFKRMAANLAAEAARKGFENFFSGDQAPGGAVGAYFKDLGPMATSLIFGNLMGAANQAASGNFASALYDVGAGAAAFIPGVGQVLSFGLTAGKSLFESLFGGKKDPQSLKAKFKVGPPGPVFEGEPWLEVARKGGVTWAIGDVQQLRRDVEGFFDDLGDILQMGFKDLVTDAEGWQFTTKEVSSIQDALKDIVGQILLDFGADLFGPDSLFAQNLPSEWWAQMAKEGETANDVMFRFAQTLTQIPDIVESINDSIAVLTAEDPALAKFNIAVGKMTDRIDELKGKLESASVLDTDPAEIMAWITEVQDLEIERFETIKEYILGLQDVIRGLEQGLHDFTVRIHTKIDALTGGSEAFAHVWGWTVDKWNQFLSEGDAGRKLEMLQDIEYGLDTALALQQQLIQAEINRLQQILSALDSLQSLSISISNKIFDVTGAYADQVGWAMDRGWQAFEQYAATPPDDIETRVGLLQEMVGWLDTAVNAAMNRWNAHYDALISAAQSQIDALSDQRSDIQDRIRDLQDQRRAIQDKYRTETDALNEQIRLSEQWKRLVSQVADQIHRMKAGLDSPADVFERMDYVRGEISRVQGLYAGAATEEDRIGYAGRLAGLYQDLLGLGQEAWQRPSPQYQALYQEVLSGLEGIQADANANVKDELALQKKIVSLNESMETELQSIDDEIADLNDTLKNLDDQIKGFQKDIKAYNQQRQEALNYIRNESLAYYQYVKDEADRIYQDYYQPTLEALKEQQALQKEVNELAVEYYRELFRAGSGIYQEQLGVYREALRQVIGNETVETYLTQQALYIGGELNNLKHHLSQLFQQLTGNYVPFAAGGRVDGPTLGLVGEAGTEWILRDQQILRLLQMYDAQRHAPAGGDNGRPVQVTIENNIHIQGAGKVEAGDLARQVEDISVRSAQHGRLRKAIMDAARGV